MTFPDNIIYTPWKAAILPFLSPHFGWHKLFEIELLLIDFESLMFNMSLSIFPMNTVLW